MSMFSRLICTARARTSPTRSASGWGKMLALALGVFACGALGWSSPSQAFELVKDTKGQVYSWKPATIRIYINPNNAGSVPAADVEQVFRKAIATWNTIKCSNFVGIFVKSGGFPKSNDKQSTIAFPANFTGTNIFQTQYGLGQNGAFTEVDVSINPKSGWILNPSGGGQDLESIAMAVIGIVLGLSSSTEPKATLGGNFLSGDISKRTLHPDDIAGVCTLYPSGQPQCSADTDCPTGLGCQAAKCIEKAPSALPKSCKPCATTAECGSTQLVCDLVGNGRHCLHKCTPDGLCPPGTACSGNGVSAQCLPSTGSCPKSSCTKDADCGAGFKCKASACVPECSADTDCTAPNVCNNGRCGPKGGCSTDLDCSAGDLCKNGVCTPNTTKQPCTNDNDCPNLFSCKNKFCERDATTGCTDGATQACTCTNGKSGSQTCANKAWGACTGCGGAAVCQAGTTQPCACPSGTNGTQSCKADGSGWDACQGCGGGGKACVPGATQACVCTDGKSGAQTCASDGTKWEACTCTGSPGTLCTAGATQGCVCNDGKNGSQTCAADGKSWGACAGCSGGPPATCTAGQSQACTCTNGGAGTQSCAADGSSWNICLCEAPGDGGTTTPDTGGGGDTAAPPQTCQTNTECPTGHFCVQGICRRSTAGDGCGCSVNNPSQGAIPVFFLVIFLLGLSFHRRLTREGA